MMGKLAEAYHLTLCAPTNISSLKIAVLSMLLTHIKKGQTMKINLATTCFIIGALLAPVAAHAQEPDSDRTHPKTFVKDSVITTKIKTKLAAENIKSLAH